LKVDFQGSRVTLDGGLILVRELDERLGFGELVDEYLTDYEGTRWRRQRNRYDGQRELRCHANRSQARPKLNRKRA